MRRAAVLAALLVACGGRVATDGVDAGVSSNGGGGGSNVGSTIAGDSGADAPAGDGSPGSSARCNGPSQLLSGPREALGRVFVDGGFVYWSEVGSIWRIAQDVTYPPQFIAATAGPGDPMQLLVIAGGYVYFNYAATAGNSIKRAPVTGGTVETVVPSGRLGAVDATHVYWTTRGPSGDAVSIMASPLSGAAPPTALLTYATLGAPESLAVDDTSIYWVDTGYGNHGAVLEMPKTGASQPTVLAAGGTGVPPAVTVDATTIYWATNGSPGNIESLAKSGTAPMTLASGQWPTPVAVDDTNVYWAEGVPGGTVWETPKSGGPSKALAGGGPETPQWMAVDDRCVYWSTMAPGNIWRAPK